MAVRSVIKIDATQAKHRFGEVLRHAGRREVVALSKRGREVAYVISPEMYDTLQRTQKGSVDALTMLEAEFDQMVARMQSPATRKAVDQLLDADDVTINRVARKSRGRKG